MSIEEMNQRIEDLENMIKIYVLIYNDEESPLYKNETIKYFLISHSNEKYELSKKLRSIQ